MRLALLLIICALAPSFASAHQPRLVESRHTIVTNPEISKAYYGQLMGTPDVFTITATSSFVLYVNVLVPDIAGQKKDVSATIKKDGTPLTVLDGTKYAWKQMFEPFGYDSYWTGPEYNAEVGAGTYTITVTSPDNDSKYSLAIGEAENFNFKEVLNALTLIPQLKTNFFDESPITFIFSPFGWGLILALYILAGIVGLITRFIVTRMARSSVRKARKNIGTADRLIRLAIGVLLLLLAITTTWNMLLIFLSGLAVFEAVFSWCVYYAAIEKSTHPN